MKTQQPPRWHYYVMNITTGVLLYRGTSLVLTAEYLEPGTCYGKAKIAEQAKISCMTWCDFFLKQKENRNGD